jgi:hypothetical protein
MVASDESFSIIFICFLNGLQDLILIWNTMCTQAKKINEGTLTSLFSLKITISRHFLFYTNRTPTLRYFPHFYHDNLLSS